MGKDDEKHSNFKSNILLQFLILLISALMLKFGADWLISGVTTIAVDFGVSDRVIAFTLVAVGTSLPELSTSFVAIYKKEKSSCWELDRFKYLQHTYCFGYYFDV